MKQKEEKLLQAQRTRTLINVEGQHLLRLVHHALGECTVKVLVPTCFIIQFVCLVFISVLSLFIYFDEYPCNYFM
jgi:hypothetical protein